MPTLPDSQVRRAVRRLPLGDRTELLVDLASGEPVLRRLDLVVAGAGGHLRLLREHRGHARLDEGFGPGWALSVGEGATIDRSREPVTVTGPHGRVTTLHRDGEGRFTKVLDPSGAQAAAFVYDAAGRIVRQWDAAGAVTDLGWDEQNRLVLITPPDGEPVRLAYDERSAVASVSWPGPDGPVVIGFAYEQGRTTVTGPTGHRTVHVFDAAGRRISVTDALGHTAHQEWDADGRPTRSTDAAGGTLVRGYDEEGRPVSLRLPTHGVFSAAYNDPSHPRLPSSLRDPAGNELVLHRDETGRVVTTRAAGRRTPLDTRAYDPGHGRLTRLTDGNGATTAFRYDPSGRLTRVVPPAPLGTTAFRYDALNRITGVTDGDGRTSGYRYDAAGRPVEVTDEDTGETLIALTHDGLGRTVRKSGPGWSYAFDWVRTAAGDRLTAAVRTDDAGSEEIRAGHDADGLLTTLTTPGGTARYTHDAAGRPASVTTPVGATALLSHDAAGRLTSVDFGPAVQDVTYDASGRRTALTVRNRSGEVLLTLEYGYCAGGGADSDVLRHTVVDGEFTGYAYDELKRLVRAGEVEYAYDEANHLVRLGDVRFTLNEAGQVTLFGRTTFAYDGAGNFVEEENPTGSFAYSITRQTLTGVFGGQRVVDIAYDGLGHETPRRITETTVDGRTVTHVLTHSQVGVVRVRDDGTPTDFVRTPDGTLLAVLTADGRQYWAVTDQQGSVLALLDEQGALAARYRYTPHGAVTATGPAAAVNPFRYRGAYQLLRSAHVLDHHLYNGFWGRFTQPDPTGRQYAPYTFADNDPLNTGTWTRGSFWAVLTRTDESATEVFFPSSDTPGGAHGDGPAYGGDTDPFTGPGTSPDRPPLIAGALPPRTV
ncbi:RHS repeat protein [Streptomyces sp. ISL-36]|uniref:DUF6531 domain-containing protein n=1 Tax=Streptomyces sp. ISL-36 TaxID=2819182 RepID=UPI001BEAF9EA|nr:DUF6531 domain-containing protein [Streptomyces sp. ISL-36]MBT2442565.1 RHS repeat protein [Streptomyces sp. ISL-36]